LAVSLRRAPRRGQIQNGLILAAVAAAAAAVLPIVVAVIGGVGSAGQARTAFAGAPAGEYAVVSRTDGANDIIAVVSEADPTSPREVARVPHLPGYAVNGSVSPDGQHVALVTADQGTQSNPMASLFVLDLESGVLKQLAGNVDVLRTAIWTADSQAVVTTRAATTTQGRPAVQVMQVAIDGSGERELLRVGNVLGVYPVGFDAQGRLVAVVIDGRGSSLVRDGQELGVMSPAITRDWRLSTDGTQLAFIESDTVGGLQYRGRVVAVDTPGPAGAMNAQALSAEGQQLGVAWKPAGGAATFGQEPERGPAPAGGVSAQALESSPGFDVPIAYAPGGDTLAVTHWTGMSFADAGRSSLELVSAGGRVDITGFARFVGWAQR
jgi:hypothetical protein